MTPDPTDDNDTIEIEQSLTDRLIECFRTYYADEIADLAQHYPNEQKSLHVDWSDLNQYDPDIGDDLRNSPERMLDELETALELYDLPVDVDLSDASVRVFNLPESSTHVVGDYSPSEIVGTFRAVQGQVSKVTQTQPIITSARFECVRCGSYTTVNQRTEDFQEPHQCSGCDRNGPFVVDNRQSQFRDYQRVRLNVPPEHAHGADESLDVVLERDLTDQVEPGDRVIANCIIRLERRGNSDTSVFDAYGEGISIEHLDTTLDDIDPEEYTDEIEEIAADSPFDKITDSIAPSHYGDRMIKEALSLQLVGGVNATHPDGSTKRGTPHVFLIGDPGSGKSQLLRYMRKLDPRSVFTAGKTTSAAGLTAAAVRDDFGEAQWSLEAGAIVEANDGLACIDELDKMSEDDQGGLYEAMSDQTVSVSKAGINVTLPARTKILAAANPSLGRFDDHTPIAEQIDLDPVLLSRFDLIFTLRDTRDEDRDRQLAGHLNDVAELGQREARDGSGAGDALDDAEPVIEPEVLRAYVSHARQITPVLTDEAKEMITEQYVDLRGANDADGPVPVTARDIGAMHRLSEASARIRLSDEIERIDVERALRVRRACLADIGIDPETGEFDVDIVETGQTQTQRDRVRTLEEIIRDLANEHDDEPGAPRGKIFDEAQEAGMDYSDIEHQIAKMADQGAIYSPDGGSAATADDDDHIRLI